ncbi:VOC family protein [Alphaproteobacteria bacterium]|nr:VOC family protein [Alphaproteobacteria bacterium]
MHKLDHIVFAASSLEEGTNFIENKLNSKLSNIGYHDFMGTYNRVIKVDKSIYLEVIAINPCSEAPKKDRWFNLDNPKLQQKLKNSPQIIGYVIETDDKEILKHFCAPITASRGDYKWNFAIPNLESEFLDPNLIESGIIPNLINWKSNKPILQMNDSDFKLNKIEIEITNNQIHYKKLINSLGIIEKLTFSIKNNIKNYNSNDYPKLKMSIKDMKTNKNILL